MQRFYFYSLLLLLALVTNITAKASHLVGSHIGYKAIDSVTYELTLTLYRDCLGTTVLPIRIGVTGKQTGYFETEPTKISTTDITGAYLNCNINSKCSNGSYPYGFEKVVYKDTIDVSGGVCEYRFSFKECCRNSAIPVVGTNIGHYNFALINKCFGINNSVQADLDPFILVASGRDVLLSTFLGDSTDKTDSVSYDLVKAFTDSITTLNYSGFWSEKRPITFLGFPNIGLSSPSGFHFDKLTGTIQFRPILINQYTVFCIEAKEYRKINGKMEVVGVTRLDHDMLVTSSPNNKTPEIKGRGAIACANQEVCLEFETDDNDTTDSTYLKIFGAPKNAIITYDTSKRLATAKLCWTPTEDDISNIPKKFVVVATDNSCTITGRTSRAFSITIRQSPDTSTFEVVSKTPQCSSAEIKLNVKKQLPGLTFDFIDEDSTFSTNLFQPRLYFKGSGWKKFYITARTSTPCVYTHTDSVFITPQYSLQFNTKNDTAVCSGDSVELFTYPTNGVAPYTYSWTRDNLYTPIDTNIFKTKVDIHKNFRAFVSDSNYCYGFTDTVFLTSNPIPVIDAGQNDSVCPNAAFSLTATHDSTIQTPHFNWLGLDTLQTISTQTTSNTWYYVTATSAEGCSYTDSTLRSVRSIGVDAGTYTSLCSGTPRQIKATSLAGIMPFKYTWLNTGDSTST